ncbi:MAG: hypothetical protein LBG65_04390 [Puniceicoccales bacterium]|jgi:hypothetical protein|nr:hypothetical protein [Puniceicoccales bacterium]
MRNTLLASILFFLLSAAPIDAATNITDAVLKGTVAVPAPSTLTVAAGATLIVEPGASVSGLLRDLVNPTLSGNITISGGGSLSVNSPALFTMPVSIANGVLFTAGEVSFTGLSVSPGTSVLAALSATDATFAGLAVSPGLTNLSSLTVGGEFTAEYTATLKSTLSVTGNSTFSGYTSHNGGSGFHGVNYHFGTDYFSGSAFLEGGSSVSADNAAQLRGIARAARYAVFEIPLGVHNRPAFTAYAEIASGDLRQIAGYNYAYGFNRTDGDAGFFASDGSFVAPVDGYYTFSVGESRASADTRQALYLNQYPVSGTLDRNAALASAGDDVRNGVALTWTGRLNAGDRVVLAGPSAITTPNYPNTRFFIARLATQPAQTWTDFELKGSVNNFEGLAEQALVYFYGSAYGSLAGTHGPIGTTKAVYYTDTLGGSDHGAARKWRRASPNFSIYQQKDTNGVVGGVIVVVPVDATINPHNPSLQFVYQRVGPARMEEIWVPITPKWLITDPRPIDQDSGSDALLPPPQYWLIENGIPPANPMD